MDVLAAQGLITFTYCLLDNRAYIQSSSSRIYQSCGIGALRLRILTQYSFGDTLSSALTFL